MFLKMIILTSQLLKSKVLGQSEQTGLYVSNGPRQFAHVLPSLCAGVEPMDQSRLTVIVLAVSPQYIDLPLQDGWGCTHVGHRQWCKSSPGIGHRIIHLTGLLVGVKLPQVTHTTSDVQMAPQGLHAMLGPVMAHVCQVGGSSLWVVQERGHQTHILAVETSRDEDSSICDGDSVATQGLVQGLHKAGENKTRATRQE